MLGHASYVHAQQAPVRQFQASMAPLLFEAVRSNNLTGVKSAVKAGADVTRKDDDGRTALDLALERGYFDIAQFLIKARQDQLAASIDRARSAEPEPASIPTPAEPPIEAARIPAPSEHVALPASPTPDSGPVDQLANTVEKLASVAEKLVQMAETSGSKNIRIEVVRNENAPAAPGRKPEPTPRQSVIAASPPDTVASLPTPPAAPSQDRASTIATSPIVPGFLPQPARKPDILGQRLLAATDAAGEPDSETAEIELDTSGAGLFAEDAAPAAISQPVVEPEPAAAPEPEKTQVARAVPEPPPEPAGTSAPRRPVTSEPSENGLDSEPISVRQLFRNLFGGGEDKKDTAAETLPEAPERVQETDVAKAAPASPPPGIPSLPDSARNDGSALGSKPVVPLSSVDLEPERSKPDPQPPIERARPNNAAGVRAQEQLAKLDQGDQKRGAAVSRRGRSAQPIKRLRAPLRDALFTIGESVTIGQPQLTQGVGEPNACVSKRGQRTFCVVPVDWPTEVESAFQVNTILYQGARALARYDRGAASHFHALFRSDDQERVLAYLKKRFGNPTDEWKRVIAPFGKPRQANPTFVWRSRNTKTKLMTILEVRKFDDSRNVFPDTEHGVVRLYVAGGPPVFPTVTALDIMSIDWAARSDHNDAATPPRANTLPIGR